MLTFAIVYSAALVVGISILAWLLRDVSKSALPNLATAAGILGTFIGIVWGLWGFEVFNIEGSIPDLLNGLKFAFLTSVIGLIVAVFIRICFIVASRRKPQPEIGSALAAINKNTAAVARVVTEESNSTLLNRIDSLERALVGEGESTLTDILRSGFEKADANAVALAGKLNSFQQTNENTAATLDTLADLLKNGFQEINANTAAVVRAVTGEDGATLLTQMREMRTTFSDNQDQLINKIDSLEQALVGEDESTLLAQMREMRATFSDKQDELIREFKQFAEKTAENSSKALIEALEKVIRDFNERITEQFGDNFRQLNEAVGQLLTWQENYKGQVEAMVGQLRKSMEALEMCEEAMIVLTERSEAFAGVADKLEETLGELSRRNEEMNAHLEALAGLGERAKSAFPAIQQNIQQITNGLTSTASGFARSAGAALKSIENQADQLEKNQAQVNAQLKASLEGQQVLMAENQKRVGAQIQETAADFKSSVETSLAGMANQREQIEKNQAIVNAGVNDAAESFKSSVETSLAGMAGQREQIEENQAIVNAGVNDAAESFKSSVESSLASMRDQRTMIESNQRAMIATIQESANRFSTSVERTLGGMRTEIVQIARTSGAELSKLTTELDTKLRKELSNSMNTLANELASLSGKFVEDYGPLTEQLRRIVRMSETILNRSSDEN